MVKLKNLIKEDLNSIWPTTEEILNFIEEEVNERYDYTVERGESYLYLEDDSGGTFEITIKNTLDPQTLYQVRYTEAPNEEYYNTKLFYVNQIDEMIHQLRPSLFK